MRKLNVEEMELIAGAGDACCTKDCPPTKREHCNNGLGNGDQLAPGNSYLVNRAENNVEGPSPSGKAVVVNGVDCRGREYEI